MKTLTLLLENFTDFLLFIVKNKYKSLHTFNSQDIALRRQRFNCLGREAVTPIRVQGVLHTQLCRPHRNTWKMLKSSRLQATEGM